ncbi:MAG: hypothetical protein RL141_806 [Candidatus Parcubacteria bacterium]|jgi:hypothetical protein
MSFSSPRLTLLVSVFLLILAATFWIQRAPTLENGTVEPPVTGLTALVAQAVEPTGDVTLIRDEQPSPVTEGMALQEQDLIRTGEGSVSLEFFSGSRVALDAHTEVRVDTATVKQTNQRSQQVEFTLIGGRVWSRVLNLLETDSAFTGHAATLTATVRGTAFVMTSHPGTAGSARRIDLFDGHLGLDVHRGVTGTLESGFSFSDGAGYAPTDAFTAHIQPTPDETRNDPWIRAQLQADKAFLQRVEAVRRQLGDDLSSYEKIGDEAGPFTLHEGMEHSSYQGIEIRPGRPITSLPNDESLTLDAIARFNEQGAVRQDEITRNATWQLSDTSLATLTNDGVLTAADQGSGVVTVVARWNDGTHEHSHSLDIRIGEILEPTITTTVETSVGLPSISQ